MSEPRQEPAETPAAPAMPLVRAPGIISLDMAVSRVRRHAGLAVSGAAGLAGEVLRRWTPRDAGLPGEGLTYAFPPVVTAEPVSSPAPPAAPPAPIVPTAAGPSLLERPRAAGGGGPVVGTLRRSLAAERPGETAPAPPVVLPRTAASPATAAAPMNTASQGLPAAQALPVSSVPPIPVATPSSPRSPGSLLSESPSPSPFGAPPAASLPPTPRLELGRPVVRRSTLASPEPLPQRREPASPPVAEPEATAVRPAAPDPPPVSSTNVAPPGPTPVPRRELGRPVVRRSALAPREALVERQPAATPGVATPAAPLPLPQAAPAPGRQRSPAPVAAPAVRPPLARASALPAGSSTEVWASGPPPPVPSVPMAGISSPPDLPLSRARSGRLGPALVQRSPFGSPPTAPPPLPAAPETPETTAAGEPVPIRHPVGRPSPAVDLPLAAPAPRAAVPSVLAPVSPITTLAPTATVARRLAPSAAAEASVPKSAALALPAAPFTGLSPNLGMAILRRRLDVPLQERLSAAAAPGVSRPETGESGGTAPSFLPLPAATPSPAANSGRPALPGPRSAAGPAALPLARVLQPSFTGQPGAIQRDLMGGTAEGTPASTAATPTPPSTPAASGGAAPAAGTAGAPAEDKTHDKAVEAEELTERVVRRVLRTLAVEGERRGLSSWL